MEQIPSSRLAGLTEEENERIRIALERIRAAFQAFADAVMQVVDAIVEVVREFVVRVVWPTLKRFVEQFRRTVFYARLRRWRVPDRAAVWIAWHWPRRWLPALGGCPPGAMIDLPA